MIDILLLGQWPDTCISIIYHRHTTPASVCYFGIFRSRCGFLVLKEEQTTERFFRHRPKEYWTLVVALGVLIYWSNRLQINLTPSLSSHRCGTRSTTYHRLGWKWYRNDGWGLSQHISHKLLSLSSVIGLSVLAVVAAVESRGETRYMISPSIRTWIGNYFAGEIHQTAVWPWHSSEDFQTCRLVLFVDPG